MDNNDNTPTVRFFANSQAKATLQCPQCGTSRTIDAGLLKNTGKRLKVTCKCGKVFRAAFEFRQHYRKTVKLAGKYKDLNSHRRGTIEVVDISMGGIGFTVHPMHRIQVGDNLEVTFNLDDPQQSEIRLRVAVRNVKETLIGAERTDTQLYQGALGFYLMT
jgi:transcription elongation factor Elf1